MRSVSTELHDGGSLVAGAAGSTTVASLFDARARARPDRLALEDARARLTYGEVAERTRRLAGALAARGVERGARIAVQHGTFGSPVVPLA